MRDLAIPALNDGKILTNNAAVSTRGKIIKYSLSVSESIYVRFINSMITEKKYK